MKFLVFLVVLLSAFLKLGLAQPDAIYTAFHNWMLQYNVSYPDQQSFNNAFQVFSTNYMKVSRQQIKYYSKHSRFLIKPNRFFIMSPTQRALTRGFKPDSSLSFVNGNAKNNVIRGRALPPTFPTPPASLDYRRMGYVTSVQDQGTLCQSCYAFASNCALEGQIAKKYGRLVNLSEQNIVDCSSTGSYGNFGCDGGDTAGCYRFINNNPGIANESVYPYYGDHQNCRYSQNILSASIVSYFYVTGNETYLKSALAAIGPLAIAIRGDLDSFAYYSSGIFDDTSCDSTLNHAVCLVGYGTDNTTNPPTDYWIMKNSWSTDWGENGYIRMQMGLNLCGLKNYVVYPTV